jgi:hypothetical protein
MSILARPFAESARPTFKTHHRDVPTRISMLYSVAQKGSTWRNLAAVWVDFLRSEIFVELETASYFDDSGNL